MDTRELSSLHPLQNGGVVTGDAGHEVVSVTAAVLVVQPVIHRLIA